MIGHAAFFGKVFHVDAVRRHTRVALIGETAGFVFGNGARVAKSAVSRAGKYEFVGIEAKNSGKTERGFVVISACADNGFVVRNIGNAPERLQRERFGTRGYFVFHFRKSAAIGRTGVVGAVFTAIILFAAIAEIRVENQIPRVDYGGGGKPCAECNIYKLFIRKVKHSFLRIVQLSNIIF